MTFTDQLHRTVNLPTWPPRRIISLVPSQTELLADLGLESEVVGITKFCVHPESWFRAKTRVGGTKTLNLNKIAALNPDLIIANREENEREQIEALAERFPVWISDIKNLDDALQMIREVGLLTGRETSAEQIAAGIESGFRSSPLSPPKTAAYLIWRKPYMAAGDDTFINSMLKMSGFKNVFRGRYPETSLQELAGLHPELILLSSEPYPFSGKHIRELQEACPDSRVLLVDGEMFSWYGSRLLKSIGYLKQLLDDVDGTRINSD